MTRARALGLHGLLTDWSRFEQEPWLADVVRLEECERKRRSLERRTRNAHIGAFKHMAHYDWSWPRTIDRMAVEDAVSGNFLPDKSNVVILGQNGVSKTMIAKNVAYKRVGPGTGERACCPTPQDMRPHPRVQEPIGRLILRPHHLAANYCA